MPPALPSTAFQKARTVRGLVGERAPAKAGGGQTALGEARGGVVPGTAPLPDRGGRGRRGPGMAGVSRQGPRDGGEYREQQPLPAPGAQAVEPGQRPGETGRRQGTALAVAGDGLAQPDLAVGQAAQLVLRIQARSSAISSLVPANGRGCRDRSRRKRTTNKTPQPAARQARPPRTIPGETGHRQ